MGNLNTKKNIIDHLICLGNDRPNDLAYRFLFEDETLVEEIGYNHLLTRVQIVAAHIRQTHAIGSRALLLYPSGIDFAVALLACFYAGVVAVPSYPPRHNRSLDRLLHITENSKPVSILSTKDILDRFQNTLAPEHPLRTRTHLATDTLTSVSTRDLAPTPYTTAFLQYTSGSTSQPKGVVVTHENILANLKMIFDSFGMGPDSIGFGWLPLFHDMGLIGNILQPLYAGIPVTLMAPISFLKKPIRWLKVISDYGITTSGGPNFAYELCIEKITETDMSGLDLTLWTRAFNGAEPIHYKTLRRFSDKFQKIGFQEHAFLPCYGMAETTLLVSGDFAKPPEYLSLKKEPVQNLETSQYAQNDYTLVGLGSAAWGDQRLKIVNPESRKELDAYTVGEVWISGTHVAAGYFENPELTTATFKAYTEKNEGPFLRTGDMGFLNKNNSLFITGRIKDMLILRGKNYYPQDIEYAIDHTSEAFAKGSSAAFILPESEKLVCMIELTRAYHRKPALVLQQLAASVVTVVSNTLELTIDKIVFLRPNTIPKTSSGKIQRSRARDMYLTQTADILFETARPRPATLGPKKGMPMVTDPQDLETRLCQWISEKTGLPETEIETAQDFSLFGLDSIALVDLSNKLEAVLGNPVPIDALYDYPTIHALSHYLVSQTVPAAISRQPMISTAVKAEKIHLPVFD
jgi:acyl-CoA synthetase (AMP-forming)/AMP-acid ligase II/acyl carrier protein